MAGGISSPTYAPGPVPADPEALPAFLTAELRAISGVIQLLAAGHIDPSYAAPAKLRNGDIRLADGISWNPGSGPGIYAYYGGSWNKLG